MKPGKSLNLFITISFIIIVSLGLSTLFFLSHVREEARKQTSKELQEAISTFWHLLETKGTDYRIVDGTLYAGNYPINGNNELPDKVREIFGGTATIFMGDTRVSTNVLKEDGTRALGTRLTGPAYDAIFRQGIPYRGEAPILGTPYITAYDPIRDRNGAIIGVLYVGTEKAEFLHHFENLESNICTGIVIMGLLLLALAWSLSRHRNRWEEQLRQAASRIQLIVDSVPAAIAYVDATSHFRFANRRYGELFNPSGKEINAARVQDILEPEHLATVADNFRAALSGRDVIFIQQAGSREGREQTFQTSYTPHRDDTGKIIGCIVQHYDITELSRIQEALRTSEEQYRTLFNTTGNATLVCDIDTTIVLANREFYHFTGHSPEEVEGTMSLTEFFAPVFREQILTCHNEHRNDPADTPSVYESVAMRHDGKPRNILAHVNSLPGTDRCIVSFLDITAQKELATSLRNQLDFLQTLIDTIPNPVFFKDRAGRYLGCNISFEAYLGLNKEQLVGKTVYDIAPPDLAERYFAMDEELFSHPGVQRYDSSVLYADGSRHEVTFNKATYTGSDGRPAGIVGVIMDMTERMRMEQLLAGERHALEMIMQEASLTTVLEKLCTIIEKYSPGTFCSVLLLDKTMHLRHAAGPSLPEDYVRKIDGTRIGPFIGSCGTAVFRNRMIVTADIATDPNWEKYRSLPLRFGFRASWSMPIRSRSGEAIGTFAIYHTVPREPDTDDMKALERAANLAGIAIERQQDQQALRESEERFRQIFTQNDDAIILFRIDDFSIFDTNPAATKLTGFTPAELWGKTPLSFIAEQDFHRLIDLIPMDDQSQTFQLDRAACRRKNGTALSIVIRAKILRLSNEYVVHCSIRDITEKIRLEEDIRATQAKLIHTNKMTSIGMLASSVAHEINNPNNCISVNATMLADVWADAVPILSRHETEHGEFTLRGIPFRKMTDFAPRLLHGITEGSRRITAIVENMREFVRDEKSGRKGLVDVNRLIRNAASILWHHIHQNTNNFRMELEENLPGIEGNGQQIEQVVINLIVNGLQALRTKQAGVTVTTCTDHGTGVVRIVVTDEGVGMEQSVLQRLAEPFFTTKITSGGTGLGLYISASILKEHQGELTFSSQPGSGTIATVSLPIAPSQPVGTGS